MHCTIDRKKVRMDAGKVSCWSLTAPTMFAAFEFMMRATIKPDIQVQT